LESRIAQLETRFQGVNRSGNNIVFGGVNVQIVNGQGTTESTNGLGNLIIGYNELKHYDDYRSGSHNLVIGKNNNFTSYAGIVSGWWNSISGPWSSVTSGFANTASGELSNVSAGCGNTASGKYSSVSGGWGNEAGGNYSTIGGGAGRSVSADKNWRAGSLFEVY